jgi:hypothetical protein
MPPERQREIEQLYLAAVNFNAEERAALLAQASPDVRQKVQAMLGHPGESDLLAETKSLPLDAIFPAPGLGARQYCCVRAAPRPAPMSEA